MAREAPRGRFRKAPVYFFYGDQTNEILNARREVVETFLPDPETRAEGLTEHTATGKTSTTSLLELLPTIAGDLETMSFVAEATKVVVVHDPIEVFKGGVRAPRRPPKKPKAKGKSGEDAPAETLSPLDEAALWFEKSLPRTGNVVILLAFEDEAAEREVDTDLPLFQTVARIGETRRFRDGQVLFFAIEDGILQRDVAKFLESMRALWNPKTSAKIYGGVVRCLRYLLQQSVLRELDRKSAPPERVAACLPSSRQTNLKLAHPNVQAKYRNAAGRFRTADVLVAYEKMLGVYEALRPEQGAIHVPDARALCERIVIELVETTRRRG